MGRASRFRKKPIEVEAVQLVGLENADEILEWVCDNGGHAELVYGPLADWLGVSIFTLEGTMEAAPGWWVVRGVEGEFCPCKPSVFDATYEGVAGSG